MKNLFSSSFLILLLILLSFTNTLAQSDTIAYEIGDTVKANSLLIEVDQLVNTNQFLLALKKLEEAKNIYSQLLGNRNEQIANTLHWEGIVWAYSGNLPKAKDAWEKALEIRLEVLGPLHEDVAKSYNNCGTIYHYEGNYSLAAEHMEKALEIQIKIKGPDNEALGDFYFNVAQEYIKTNNLEKAEPYHLKALELTKKLKGANDPMIIESYNALASCYRSKEEFQKALTFGNKSLDLYNKINPNDLQLYAMIHETLGLIHFHIGELGQSNEYFLVNLNTLLKLPSNNQSQVASAYNNLGLTARNKGDYILSNNYFQRSLEINKKSLRKNHPDIAGTYNNIAISHQYNGDYDLALEFLKKALFIYKENYTSAHLDIALVHQNIGGVLNSLNRHKEAIEEFQKSVDIRQKLLGEQSQSVAIGYFTLGTTYEKLRQKKLAIEHLEKSISIFENIEQKDMDYLAIAYYNLGIILNDSKDAERSINYIQKAININSQVSDLILHYKGLANRYANNKQHEKAEAAFKNAINAAKPNDKTTIEELNHPATTVDLFIDYGNFNKFLFKTTKNIEKLKEAQLNYRYALKIIDHQYNSLNNFSSKSTLTSQTFATSTNAIETNHLLYKQTKKPEYQIKNFDLAEQSKSFLLFQALQNSKAISFSNIPQSILKNENTLRIDITYYEKLIHKKISNGIPPSDSSILTLNNKIFDLKRQYESLKSNLETNYPDYYKAKYDLSTITLNEVQQNLLQSNQSLIEYVIGDSNSYILLINPDTFLVHEVPMNFSLNQWVESFREGLTKYYTTEGSPKSILSKMTKQYATHGQQLYQKLIEPIAPYLNKELIIIPNGVLGYLPFEILLSEKPTKLTAFHDYPYLLKKHNISYCYSATLLQEMIQRQHPKSADKNSLAIAPFFKGDIATIIKKVDAMDLLALRSDTLQALPFSGDEAAKVAKITKGDQWLGGEASLNNFIQKAPDYRILHLSTHGIADDKVGDYAYLAFGDSNNKNQYEKLFIRDIYNIPLNADMVVLSACKTAYGKLQKGEGIISMARAFAYAGAKSIITSHWSVDDKSTGLIMEDFYINLAKGNTKNQALQNAKLKYIENNKGLKAHPFFWAPFVGIGDMSKIQ